MGYRCYRTSTRNMLCELLGWHSGAGDEFDDRFGIDLYHERGDTAVYGACSGDELTIRRLKQYTVFKRAGNRLLLAYGERDSDEDGAEPMDSEATISEEGGRADQRSGQGTKREAPVDQPGSSAGRDIGSPPSEEATSRGYSVLSVAERQGSHPSGAAGGTTEDVSVRAEPGTATNQCTQEWASSREKAFVRFGALAPIGW